MAKTYGGEPGKDFNFKSGNLSSTLEKLYAWEKKLYKEVKVCVHKNSKILGSSICFQEGIHGYCYFKVKIKS